MKIRTVSIIGAGAIGAYFIWGLSDKLGKDLTVIADGERARRLRTEGLWINGKARKLHVRTAEEAGKADLLLVCTKSGSLQEALPEVAEAAGGQTTVMSLLNGVDSEEILAGEIGRERILYSLMKISSERKGNTIRFNGPATMGVYYGEAAPAADPAQQGFGPAHMVSVPGVSERMRALADLFEGTPIHYHPCDDILKQIWYKYAVNVSRNLPQAILGSGAGAYDDSSHVNALCGELRAEVVAVAAAQGIDLTAGGGDGLRYTEINKWARYSTLQDLDAGRHTEIDIFSGAMIRMGRKYGIPVPCNEFVYHAIRALEEKNDGKFDYPAK